MFKTDQAAGLRRLFALNHLRIIVLGGAARIKADAAVNLAKGLSEQGNQVMIMDGTANELRSMLGLQYRYELNHMLSGDKRLSQILLRGAGGVQVLPATRGLEQLNNLTAIQVRRFRHEFSLLPQPVNTLLVNAPSQGVNNAFAAFQGRARMLMAVSDSPASITAAYGEIKLLRQQDGVREFDVVVVAPCGVQSALAIHANMAKVAERFLSVKLNFRGFVPVDETHHRSSKSKQSMLTLDGASPPPEVFRHTARDVDQWLLPDSTAGNMEEASYATAC